MPATSEPPRHVRGLAEQRAKARAERDFTSADVLRSEIEEAGWLVRDTSEGFELAPRPPFEVWPTVRTLSSQTLWNGSLATSRIDEGIRAAGFPDDHATTPSQTVTVGLVVDGWPADLRKCVDAVIAYTDARILAIDLGDVDGAGTVLHELAAQHPGRITEWHVAETPHWRGGSAGWGASRTKLLHLDTGEIHVVMETSTVLDGDAITPLVEAVRAGATAAGWQGVEPDDGGHDWHGAGPGKVTALLGYLFAVRRDRALGAGGFPERAHYYRNADLEFSLSLPGDLVVPDTPLPVHQERHRAYEEVDPAYRDRESRRTYERVLRLLRAEAPR
jgi:hypothetical protein